MTVAEALVLASLYDFFFFQAEDGIRDRTVTGVQTCALPISINTWIFCQDRLSRERNLLILFSFCYRLIRSVCHYSTTHLTGRNDMEVRRARHESRSEERRVGKECRK